MSRDFAQFGAVAVSGLEVGVPCLASDGDVRQIGLDANLCFFFLLTATSFLDLGLSPMKTGLVTRCRRCAEKWLSRAPFHENPMSRQFFSRLTTRHHECEVRHKGTKMTQNGMDWP